MNTRSTTIRPFVYNLPSSEHSEEPASIKFKKTKENIDEKYNATVPPLDDSLANKTQISTKSFYCSTPNKSVSPRKQRYISRTLLMSFNLSQVVTENNVSKTSDAQKEESKQMPLDDLFQEESVGAGKLKNSRRAGSVHMTPQKLSNISQSEFGSHPPQKEIIITKRKNRYPTNITASYMLSPGVSHPEFSSYPPQEETIITKRKNRHPTNISVSHGTLQETSIVCSKTSIRSKIESINSPVTSRNVADLPVMSSQSPLVHKNLTLVPVVTLEKISLSSATLVEENNLENKKPDINLKDKSDSMQEELNRMNKKNSVFIETSNLISQKSPLINKTSTPTKLNSIDESNKNLFQNSAIIPHQVSPVAVEEDYPLTDASAINRKSGTNFQRSRESSASTQENIYETFQESIYYQGIKLKKCNVVIEYIPVPSSLKYLIKEASKETSNETKENENNEMPNYNERIDEYSTIEDESTEGKKEQENITDIEYSINVKKDNEQEILLNKSTTPTKSVTSFSHSHLQNSTAQLKNQSKCTKKNNALTKTISDISLQSLNVQHKISPQSTNSSENTKQEELVLVKIATSTKSVTSFPHAPLENSFSQLKSQSEYTEENKISDITPLSLSEQHKNSSQLINTNKNIEQEELLLVSHATTSGTSFVHTPLENSTPHQKNQSDYTQINNALTKKISDISPRHWSEQRKTFSKSSGTVESVTNNLNEQPQNLASESRDPVPLMFEGTEPFLFRGRELRHPSRKHLTYSAIVGSSRRTGPRQPRKPKHKTTPDSTTNQTPEKHPLFEEHRKIKLWKGKTGKRLISDLSDLDVASNVIDQVIEEISEEDQRKQEILHQIQEKYHSSIHEMIMNVQGIKKKKKEANELMATVKELAGELDQIVDHKLRLQSQFLELKAQRKMSKTINGPTWEDFNYL